MKRVSTSSQDGTHSRLQAASKNTRPRIFQKKFLFDQDSYLVLLMYDCKSSLLGAIGGISPASQEGKE